MARGKIFRMPDVAVKEAEKPGKTRVIVSLPLDLAEALRVCGVERCRSLTGEIVWRLRQSLVPPAATGTAAYLKSWQAVNPGGCWNPGDEGGAG